MLKIKSYILYAVVRNAPRRLDILIREFFMYNAYEKEKKMRRVHGKDLKFRVALEALRGDLTVPQIISKYGIAESLVHRWKKQLLESGADIFSDRRKGSQETITTDVKELHAKIGQLILERDFLEESLFKNR